MNARFVYTLWFWPALSILSMACQNDRSAERAEDAPAPAGVGIDTSFAKVVGIASTARDQHDCLTIANATLRAGTQLRVVSARPPQRIDTAVVIARRGNPCTEPGDEWGNAGIENAVYYNIEFAGSNEFRGPAIALALPVNLLVQAGMVSGDLDGDGAAERFHECTSSEGIHYFVFTRMIRRWHAYYYVPYDLEPDCDDALFTTSS